MTKPDIEARADFMAALAWINAFAGNEHLLVEHNPAKQAEHLAVIESALATLQEMLERLREKRDALMNDTEGEAQR